MKKLTERIRRWYYFHLANPVVRRGEKGGFKWEFRRFWLDIMSLSGNFSARFIAAEHPYAYLLAGKDDRNIEGFCQMVYTISMNLTTDQGFVDEINRAWSKYMKRLEKQSAVVENDEIEEKAALEFEKSVQEHIELPKKERRKVEHDINGRFKKAVKKAKAGTDFEEKH